MWFGVLGRLEVRQVDGGSVAVAGPARRRVLAALLCRRGEFASAAALIDDVWGAAPPRSALGTLRSHVVRLRDDLGRANHATVLITEGDGYRLAVDANEIDAGQFEQLVSEAARMSDAPAAILRYDQALALWRGDAYLEFEDAPFAVAERIRLAEVRSFARERRTDLALAVGMAGALIGELEQHVRLEPYRERGWEQLALALYRDGRQADALGACRRARSVLVEDLGVDPGPSLRFLEERLLRQDPDLLVLTASAVQPTAVLGRCPYLGLASYQERDAALFVGRERLTSILAGHLADQSVVLVTGPSGVGKSSLVRAGLVSALRAGALTGSAAWRIEIRTPAGGLVPPDTRVQRSPDLVVLDQAEELFTSLEPAVRDEFITRLARYVDDERGRVVVVLRSDFYGRIPEVELLASFAQKNAVAVGPMREDELRRALLEPASSAGLRLEPELIETIMDDVAGQPEPLPLLSEAMVRTWQKRDGDLLTLEGYRLAGELSGALEAAAEECYARMSDAERLAARHLLVRMAARSGTTWVGRPLTHADTASSSDAEQQALAALVSARLVFVAHQRVGIAHDALLVHWPRLRDWLDERAMAADLVDHLDQAATAWRASGRQHADLYRGPRLTAATDWRAAHPEDVSQDEGDFLDASAGAAEAELDAARARAEREARGRRRLRYVAMGLAAMVALALAGGGIALRERSNARAQTKRAEQAALAADARRLAALSANAPDIATSSLLAAAAYRLQSSPDSQGALLAAVERSQSALFRIDTQNRIQEITASADGRSIFALDNSRNVTVYDTTTRQRVSSYPARATDMDGLTADGTQLVVSGQVPGNDPDGGGRVSVLSASDGSTIRVLTTGADPDAPPPQVSRDGRWLAAVLQGTPDVLGVYNTGDWLTPPRRIAVTTPVVALASSADTFALELSDGTVEIVDASSGRTLGHARDVDLATTPDNPGPLAVSSDGVHVAAVAPGDPTVPLIIDVVHPDAAAVRLPAQTQGVGALAFAPSGQQIAVASQVGEVAVYRSADGSTANVFPGHAGAVHTLAWVGPNDTTALYSGGLDSEIVSWDLATTPRLVRLAASAVPEPDHAEVFGNLIVGATPAQQSGDDSGERLYTLNEATGEYQSWPLGTQHDDYVNQTVASADGRFALVSIQNYPNGPNRIELWDLKSGTRIGGLQLPTSADVKFAAGLNAAISPDGRTAVCSLDASTIGVFELPSGRFVRSYSIRLAAPDSERLVVVPWQFDPHGRLLLGAFDQGPPQLAPPGAPTSSAATGNPPNQRLALFDVHSGRLLAQTGLGDVHGPSAVAWSHDGSLLAVGTYQGTLTLYDAATLRARAAAGSIVSGYVESTSFSPDDQTLVVGGTDAEMSFFSVPDLRRDGTRIQPAAATSNAWYAFYNTAGQVVGLAPSPGQPPGLHWFTFPGRSDDLLTTACQLAGADITTAQWLRYVGDRPYQSVCPAAS